MRWQERIADLTARIHRLRQPVIAAVNGVAYGGGMGIALACDIRIGTPATRFCTQFIKLGLGGCDIGVSYTLPRIIGAGPAFDLILTARAVDGDEALRLGLVSRLSANEAVVDDALAIAETLCGYGRFGVESASRCSGRTSKHRAWRRPCTWRTAVRSWPPPAARCERLARRSAAVHDDHRARHVAARVGCQQQSGADHFVNRCQPLHQRSPTIASMASCGFLRIMSVSTGPGAMALTRMPLGANSAAIERVNDISAALPEA